MSRIANLPIYSQRDDEISATIYNAWRRARLHFECPIRIALVEMPNIVIILEDEAWICIDQYQNDLPLIAWLAFEDKQRQSLHLPIKCTLTYYHFLACKIRQPVLDTIAEVLQKRLQNR